MSGTMNITFNTVKLHEGWLKTALTSPSVQSGGERHGFKLYMGWMCKDDSDINTIAKCGKATLMINVAYTKAVDHRKLHSGPRRIHIILRNRSIILHTSWYALGWRVNICSDRISLMVLLISTLIWTCCKSGSRCNRKASAFRIMLGSYMTGHQDNMHLLFGNRWVRFSENAGLAVGHQCCPLHLTGHVDTQTSHQVIIYSGAS